MATRNITITYPDGEAARVLAALKIEYGRILDAGVYRDMTNAEAFVALEQYVKDYVKRVVRKTESETAKAAAEAAIVDASIT